MVNEHTTMDDLISVYLVFYPSHLDPFFSDSPLRQVEYLPQKIYLDYLRRETGPFIGPRVALKSHGKYRTHRMHGTAD